MPRTSKGASCHLAFVLAVHCALAGGAFAQTAAEYNSQGVELYSAKQWEDSIEAFERGYELAPENTTIRRNLSNAYQAYASQLATDKNLDAAIQQLELAIGADPEQAQPLIQLGAYYIQKSLVPDAIFRLEEAIELEPRNVEAHFWLGEAYYRDNDVTHALDQWEWVYQVEPDRKGLAERMEKALREEKVEFDFDALSSAHFNISYNRHIKLKDVRIVLNVLETAYREIGRSLGSTFPPTPIQVSLYRAEGFFESTQMGEHVGALYDGKKIKVPVFDKQGQIIERAELERRLYHEYVHVVVHSIAQDNVPWWLNEGLAEVLSHELADNAMKLLRRAKEEDVLFSLSELTDAQLQRLEPESLNLAYRQAHAAVTVLRRARGLPKIVLLLHELADGQPAEASLYWACRFRYTTLDLAVADFIENE